jgi:glucose dehydrogenase
MWRPSLIGAVLICTTLGAQDARSPGVTYQDLRDGFKNTSRWLTYSGDYSSQRHSPLTQITSANVNKLEVQWTFDAIGMYRGRDPMKGKLEKRIWRVVITSQDFFW